MKIHKFQKTKGNDSSNSNIDNQYHSVEFSINSLSPLYQFKIWNSNSDPMFVLVKDHSNILRYLEEGKKFKLKYYGSDSSYPTEYHDTQIEHIQQCDNGKFKGHYTVSLSFAN